MFGVCVRCAAFCFLFGRHNFAIEFIRVNEFSRPFFRRSTIADVIQWSALCATSVRLLSSINHIKRILQRWRWAHQLPANMKKETYQPNDLYCLPFASFSFLFRPRLTALCVISTMNNGNVDGDSDDCPHLPKHTQIFWFFSLFAFGWFRSGTSFVFGGQKEMKTLHLCHLWRVSTFLAMWCQCRWQINTKTCGFIYGWDTPDTLELEAKWEQRKWGRKQIISINPCFMQNSRIKN